MSLEKGECGDVSPHGGEEDEAKVQQQVKHRHRTGTSWKGTGWDAR